MTRKTSRSSNRLKLEMWIKICGIKDPETAVSLAEIGVDAIGLNFYKPSCRYIEPVTAKKVVDAVSQSIEVIGLFVNHEIDHVHEICQQTGIRTIQLHGDETVDDFKKLSQLDEYRLIRVHRSKTNGSDAIQIFNEDLQSFQKNDVELYASLVDAYVEGDYGGTGQTAAWDDWKPESRKPNHPNFILAGGLSPENIQDAIQTVAPWGVDVAGGVESERGVKDLELCQKFIDAAKLT